MAKLPKMSYLNLTDLTHDRLVWLSKIYSNEIAPVNADLFLDQLVARGLLSVVAIDPVPSIGINTKAIPVYIPTKQTGGLINFLIKSGVFTVSEKRNSIYASKDIQIEWDRLINSEVSQGT